MTKRPRPQEDEKSSSSGGADGELVLYNLPPVRERVEPSLGGIRTLLRFLSTSQIGEATVEVALRDAIRRDIVGQLDWSQRPIKTPRISPEYLAMEWDLFGVHTRPKMYPNHFMHFWDFAAHPDEENAKLRRLDKSALVDLYRSVFHGLVVLACVRMRYFTRRLADVWHQQHQIVIRENDDNRLLTLFFRGGMIEADVAVDDTPFAASLGEFLHLFDDREDDDDDDAWVRAFARFLCDLFFNVSPRCAITFDAVVAHAPVRAPDEDNWALEEDLRPPFPGGTLSLATNGQLLLLL